MRRVVWGGVLAVVCMVVTASPASAHGLNGTTPSNCQTTITAVSPPTPGLSITVIDNGDRLELTSNTAQTVIVKGYEGEPYLRIDAGGIWTNVRSPAVSINRSRFGTTPGPNEDAKAPPQWEHTSNGHTARWHDHRIHWMTSQDPPQVQRNPGQRIEIIPRWTVAMTVGTQDVDVTGKLLWIPGPSPWKWWSIAAVLALAVGASGWLRRWWPIVLFALAATMAIDVLHTVGIALETSGGLRSQLGRGANGSVVSIVGWVTAVVALLWARRAVLPARYLAPIAAWIIVVAGGLGDRTVFARSQVPFPWGATTARVLTAGVLGLGFGVMLASIGSLVRERRDAVRRR